MVLQYHDKMESVSAQSDASSHMYIFTYTAEQDWDTRNQGTSYDIRSASRLTRNCTEKHLRAERLWQANMKEVQNCQHSSSPIVKAVRTCKGPTPPPPPSPISFSPSPQKVAYGFTQNTRLGPTRRILSAQYRVLRCS